MIVPDPLTTEEQREYFALLKTRAAIARAAVAASRAVNAERREPTAVEAEAMQRAERLLELDQRHRAAVDVARDERAKELAAKRKAAMERKAARRAAEAESRIKRGVTTLRDELAARDIDTGADLAALRESF